MIPAALLVLAAALPASCAAPDKEVWGIVDGDPVYTVMKPDMIRSIDEPRFASVRDARNFMRDDELVIGLSGFSASSPPKAYPTELLDRHEIVNDRAGDTPVAVTW